MVLGGDDRESLAAAAFEAAARKLEGLLGAVRGRSSGSEYRAVFMDGAAEALAQAIPEIRGMTLSDADAAMRNLQKKTLKGEVG